MLMTPPTGGDSFVGTDGFTYTAATGVALEVGGGGVRQALQRNWTEIPYALAATVLVPLTGFSFTLPNQTTALLLTPAGTLATGTVILPPGPADNAPVRIASSQTVTSLTVSPNTGQSISGAPTTISPTAPVEYFYNAQTATWYRR